MKGKIFSVFTAAVIGLWIIGISSGPRVSARQDQQAADEHMDTFRQTIPAIANRYIGIPYQFGGSPIESGTTDNSNLFFTIYALAAQQAGLIYKEYLPMKYLLARMVPVDENDLQAGDLMVLDNDLAAMVFRIENTGKIHLIYASEKRQKVLAFNSGNLVFDVFWLENLKGFYRLPGTMLSSSGR